ncbi:hypothetical protein ACQ4N7_29385 [Nodosilinea sp. AN01ver1]|uniref:hypothetical protein n=1 Tax=Nodosilinea sp. AN01ver1 TaxID=3423362 RepID=UPI003D31E4E7
MGALGIVTTTGTALALVVGWVALKRSQNNSKRLRKLEERLQNFNAVEDETFRELRQLLNGLEAKVKGQEQDKNGKQSPTMINSSLHGKVALLLDSLSITEEDRRADKRVSNWLYDNQTEISQSVAKKVLEKSPDHISQTENFSDEISTCIAMTAGMIQIDHPDGLQKVWSRLPRHALPSSFYLLALQEIIALTQSEQSLPSEEKTIIKKYFEALIAYGNNNRGS